MRGSSRILMRVCHYVSNASERLSIDPTQVLDMNLLRSEWKADLSREGVRSSGQVNARRRTQTDVWLSEKLKAKVPPSLSLRRYASAQIRPGGNKSAMLPRQMRGVFSRLFEPLFAWKARLFLLIVLARIPAVG
jgi:hypothetical protein